MTLVPAKSIEALQQRIAYLEEQVTSLTQAWQHIDTHRICVSDPKGESETCLTKPELDALLAKEAPAPVAEGKPVAEPPAVAAAPPAVQPVESVATVETAEPPATVAASETQKDEPDLTGSIKPAAPAPEAAALEHPAEEGDLH